MASLRFLSAFERQAGFLRLARHRTLTLVVFIASLYATAVAAQQLFVEHRIPNLAKTDIQERENFLKRWKQGDVVALVRHVERCDRSDAPCLNVADGITTRATEDAAWLGSNFRTLGLATADIYTSYLTRAVQTSTFMFNAAVPKQDWLAECRTGFRQAISEHKKAGRNLILVTHSECINGLEADLGLPSYRTPQYGASLFFTLPIPEAKPDVIGYLNSSDWHELAPAFAGLASGRRPID